MKPISKIISSLLSIFVLATVFGVSNGIASPYQESQPLKFKLEMCALGDFGSSQIYTVSDGTTLDSEFTFFKSSRQAQNAMKKQMKATLRIVSKEDQLDNNHKKIGESVIALESGDDGKESTVMISLRERSLYRIRAASLRHIKEFQKSNLD